MPALELDLASQRNVASARSTDMKEGGNRDEMEKKYSNFFVFFPSDPVGACWWPNVTESQPAT